MTGLGKPFEMEGHEMTRAYGDMRFRFCPCGFKARDFDTIVYVHYKSLREQNYDSKPTILSADVDHVHFDFPDRELLFSRQSMVLDGDRPFNEPKRGKQWHQAVAMSLA